MQGLEHLSYEERLRVEAVQPGEEKAPGTPFCGLSVLKGVLWDRWGQLFSGSCFNRIRSNGFKVIEGSFTLDIRKKFFTIRVAKHWKRSHKEAVDSPSPGNIKGQVG